MKINHDRQMSFVVYIPAEQIDIQQARLLRKINCVVANVGLQSVQPQALANVTRKFNAEKFVRGCRYLMEAGIPLEIDTIIGLSGDTLDGFHQTVAFMQQHGLCRYPNQSLFFLFSMMPGAPLRQ